MLTELCGYLRNYFDRRRYFGDFRIVDGIIMSTQDLALLDGQYIRIVGSVLNDGVWLFKVSGIEGLRDEVFNGAVWSLAIPQAGGDLNAESDAWKTKYEGADSAAMSPFTSESFGGYSYSKGAARGVEEDGSLGGWQAAFANRLIQWRKI